MTVRNLPSGNLNMALKYFFDLWDCTAYGLSQACTAGITEPLRLSRDLVCKYSKYFLDGLINHAVRFF